MVTRITAAAILLALVGAGCMSKRMDAEGAHSTAGEEHKRGTKATRNAVKQEAERQAKTLPASELNVESARMAICSGSPIPAGWILVDDRWDPTTCGNPTNITYNVWIIERYNNKPVNAVMDVCASAPTPTNWVVKGTRWSPTSCGHPSNIVQNLKRIQRVQ